MDIIETFEEAVSKHSLFPTNLLYNSNALCGEVGEIANIVKKIQMATAQPDWVTQDITPLPTIGAFKAHLKKELGDALFYLTRVGFDLGVGLSTMMSEQVLKLEEQSNHWERTFLK